METKPIHKKGWGVNQCASEIYNLYHKEREPQLDLPHYLPLRNLNFCHEFPVETLVSVENQAHHAGHVKQQFHLKKHLQKKHSCC